MSVLGPLFFLALDGQEIRLLTCSKHTLVLILTSQLLQLLLCHRVTGNCVNDFVMGSILNAVQRLGARLVLVMGHTRCTIVAKAVHAWAKEQKKGWPTFAGESAQAGPSSKPDLQPIVEVSISAISPLRRVGVCVFLM